MCLELFRLVWIHKDKSRHCADRLRYCVDVSKYCLDMQIYACLDTYEHGLDTSRHCLACLDIVNIVIQCTFIFKIVCYRLMVKWYVINLQLKIFFLLYEYVRIGIYVMY